MTRSLTSTNDFFVIVHPDERSHRTLSLREITTVVRLWAYSNMSIARAAKAADVANGTIVVWFGACRNVCPMAESVLPKIRGT